MRQHIALRGGQKGLGRLFIDAPGQRLGRGGAGLQRFEDRGFAGGAVPDQPVDTAARVLNGRTVPGVQHRRLKRAQASTGAHEVGQIPIRRGHKGTGPPHHQIAAKDRVGPLKTHVIAQMSRRPMGHDPPFGAFCHGAICHADIRPEIGINAFARIFKSCRGKLLHHRAAACMGRPVGQNRRTGDFRQSCGQRAMVEMAVRDKNMGHALLRFQSGEDRAQMPVLRGTGVNHGNVSVPEQIGVRPPKGHGRGIGRNDPAQPWGQRFRLSCRRRGMFCPKALFVAVTHGYVYFMNFDWLKPYMPRGLYGRTTLILLLPVISVMLVVSVVFIQRHFAGGTKQMTLTASREVQLLLESGDDAAQIAATSVAETLQVALQDVPIGAAPSGDERLWYDFTGRFVTREFRLLLPELEAVSLLDKGVVHLYFPTGEDLLRITFDRRRVSASNPHQLLVNMVAFALIMTVIAYFYLRNQLRPITRLAEVAEAFGRGRHLEYRPAGAIEVRAAGSAFVDMRARIERQIEQRTLMLSGVSHDLRTPLTRLKLALSMLDAPEADRAAIEQDVSDMERLISEFLAFARGAQEGEPEPTDPIELCRGIVEDFQRMGKAVRLRDVDGQGPVVLRAVAVKRAGENLVGNAVRYGNRADVSVHLTPRSLRIRVEDDGPGIPEAQRKEAIKPFARLDEARNQNLGTGVGLGLSIALDIARAHGGTLRLGESDALGGLQADIVIGR